MKAREGLLAALVVVALALCPARAGAEPAGDAPAVTPAVTPAGDAPAVTPAATPSATPAASPDAPAGISVYRLYNPSTGEHFYTQSPDEHDSLCLVGWRSEGVGWTAPSTGDPVYRLYNSHVVGGDHHYTTSADERDALVAAGWSYEGVGWYSDREQGAPLLRQYNPNAATGTHNFTLSVEENLNLVSHGWRHEGVAWYALDTRSDAPTDGFSGWVEVGSDRFFGYGDGTYATGWASVGGTRLHFDARGRLDTGLSLIDGTYYLLGSDGTPVGGWSQLMDFRYYFDPGTGELRRDGWFEDGGSTYYLDPTSGAMATGLRTIDGTPYLFNEDGSLNETPGLGAMMSRAQGCASSTSWLIMVDTTNNYLGIFSGGRGGWNLRSYWLCTTGAPSSPTVLGEYTVTGKGYSFNGALSLPAYTCYYYTQFYGDYLIHSVEYYQNTFDVLDGRLGLNLSHGCVRLPIDQAKWIYDNIPYGTKVVTYR